jgi:hypothetical protein
VDQPIIIQQMEHNIVKILYIELDTPLLYVCSSSHSPVSKVSSVVFIHS